MTKQQMALKPSANLVTRLFLSPNLRQNLNILAYSGYDLTKAIKEFAESNPFVSVKIANSEVQTIDWIEDSGKENLVDHLLRQVALENYTFKEKERLKFLIYNLDADGYLRVDLKELSSKSEYSLFELKKAKIYLQKLDPLGIGARDLNECLLIQANQLIDFDKLALKILNNHQLELLADPDKWTSLSDNTEKIRQALLAIQTLNPTPASNFSKDEAIQYLIPDLIFSWEGEQLIIRDNRNQIPEIIFDQEEYDDFKDKIGKNDIRYLTKQKSQYLEMQDAINRRYQTLLRIGKYIGKVQHNFFKTKDTVQLTPLGLKQVADKLSLASSTISRAIKDKYFELDGKTYSLKLLFPRQAVGGFSQIEIEEKLQSFIKNEDKDEPLSDDAIVEKFATQEIKVSRRLIAKYRKRLGIKNSYQRRQKGTSH